MIQFLIAILLGLACYASTPETPGNSDPGYSTTDTGDDNGQIPPPPPPPPGPEDH